MIFVSTEKAFYKIYIISFEFINHRFITGRPNIKLHKLGPKISHILDINDFKKKIQNMNQHSIHNTIPSSQINKYFTERTV